MGDGVATTKGGIFAHTKAIDISIAIAISFIGIDATNNCVSNKDIRKGHIPCVGSGEAIGDGFSHFSKAIVIAINELTGFH